LLALGLAGEVATNGSSGETTMTLEYRLMKGDILLGELFDQSVDQPWFIFRFVPTPEFETVRALLAGTDWEELKRQDIRLVDGDTGANAVFASGYNPPMSIIFSDDEVWFGLI